MPIYQYECSTCGKITDLFISMKEAEEKIMCECGEAAYRIISGCTFLLKGPPEGWYKPAAKDPSPAPTSGGPS